MVRPLDAAALAAGTLLALGLFMWGRMEEEPASSTTVPAASEAPARTVVEVPSIDLARLDTPPPAATAGRRDVFDFAGPAPAPSGATPVPSGGPVVTLPPVSIDPTPTPVPSLSVRFIGAVEKNGARVAVLMTEKKEILTGQAGDVVANRLRIVRIGLESVDVEDVGGGAPRRLPLRAN
jgi:hypothetical protein